MLAFHAAIKENFEFGVHFINVHPVAECSYNTILGNGNAFPLGFSADHRLRFYTSDISWVSSGKVAKKINKLSVCHQVNEVSAPNTLKREPDLLN